MLLADPTSFFVGSRAIKEHRQIMSSNPLSQKEWEELQATLPQGSHVRGKVVSVHPFGVFVDIGLDPRIPVLLEIIHFKVIEDQPGHRISSAEDYPAVGDEIEARILAYSLKPHDIRLTQLSHLEWIHSKWLKEQPSQAPGEEEKSTTEA
jgi:ribosomal protein S1